MTTCQHFLFQNSCNHTHACLYYSYQCNTSVPIFPLLGKKSPRDVTTAPYDCFRIAWFTLVLLFIIPLHGPTEAILLKIHRRVDVMVIVTSYDVNNRSCGPQWKHFWTYYLSFKFRCHSFNILGVKRWGQNPPPPRSHKSKKSPV